MIPNSITRQLSLLLVMAAIAAAGLTFPARAEVAYRAQSELGNTLKLPVHEWVNTGTAIKGIIVANQGLVFDGTAYDAVAKHLASVGYAVFATDFRGFGAWLTQSEEFGGDKAVHFTQTKDDLTKLLVALRKNYPGVPVYLMGESIGANYSIWEAWSEPKLVDGVISLSACFQLRVHPRMRWPLTFAQGLMHPKKPLNIAPYLEPILSENRKLSDACLNDPKVRTRLSATDLIKAAVTNRNSLAALEQIPPNMPILLITGAKDEVGNQKRAHTILDRFGSKRVQLVEFRNRGHLLIEHQKLDPQLAQTIDTWLSNLKKPITSPEITETSDASL